MSDLQAVELLLLRHGIAEDQKPGGADADRELTSAGRHKLRDVLHVAREVKVKPTLILTSPLQRARQTAEIAGEVLEYKGDILHSSSLKPDSTPEEVWGEIRGHRSESSLLLVGHEPLFSRLGAYLLGAPDMQIDFKKGAILKLTMESFPPHPRGVLAWYLTPRLAAERD